MGRMPRAAYVWPGLPMLLATGNWWGLAWAVGFALLLNTLILATLWWPELLSFHLRNAIGLAAIVLWGGAAVASAGAIRRLAPAADPQDSPTFGDATTHYLRGDYFEAERILVGLLRRNPRDIDAGLMLATLWRRTGRLAEASRQLDRLELLEESRKWSLEIYQERKRLEKPPSNAESKGDTAPDVAEAA